MALLPYCSSTSSLVQPAQMIYTSLEECLRDKRAMIILAWKPRLQTVAPVLVAIPSLVWHAHPYAPMEKCFSLEALHRVVLQ